MRRILMVAFHFPPLAGSSGIQRTLRFAQQLPHFGWEVAVLTANARAFERTSDDLTKDIPPGTLVERAFALDTARHFSVGGRYWSALARPDRWASWRFDAVRRGIRLIANWKPSVIWSTYPIATAHVIAHDLQQRSGLPWVADFRDPMAQDGFPADPHTWQHFDRIERATIKQSSMSVFTTPGAAREYQQRYPEAADRIHVIENGYDEESFADTGPVSSEPLNPGAITLLHSGIVYGSERDPTCLMQALRELQDKGVIRPGSLLVRFRASAAEDLVRSKAEHFGVQDYIELCPAIPYRQALNEMLRADVLLVLQASNCNAQIPAKIYEYIRADRPMLCLTDPQGDTASVARQAGIEAVAPLDDPGAIASLLANLLVDLSNLRFRPTPQARQAASRISRTKSLAELLDCL